MFEQSEAEAQGLVLLEALHQYGRDLSEAQAAWDRGERISPEEQSALRDQLRRVDQLLAQFEATLP